MLNDMIQEFRKQKPSPIPDHLLHVADSIRLIGNVPGVAQLISPITTFLAVTRNLPSMRRLISLISIFQKSTRKSHSTIR